MSELIRRTDIQKSKKKNEGGGQQVFKRKQMLMIREFSFINNNTYVAI